MDSSTTINMKIKNRFFALTVSLLKLGQEFEAERDPPISPVTHSMNYKKLCGISYIWVKVFVYQNW